MKIRIALILGCVIMINLSFGQTGQQDSRVITTAVPFLMISPDARSGGMANVGASTTADVYSLYWNPAKYAFSEKDFGFGVGYVPWLRNVVNDIGLASISGFKKFGDKQAIGASLRFFSMGAVMYTDENGNDLGEYKPNELAVDATYSRKFSREIAVAVAGRFIYSNLVAANVNTNDVKAGISVAADVAFYWHKELEIKGLNASWFDLGVDISNIGSKISYSGASTMSDFIPTNLRVGPSFTMDLDDYNRLSFMVDFNKLLVPTPPIYYPDSVGPDGQPVIQDGMDPNVSPIKGMIQSFYDAPGGFKEEMQEITIGVGIEYWYNKLFAIRTGYFYESPNKGDRQYFNLGVGLRYNVFGLDFSYLIPVKNNNPLQNTLQFTLLFNFEPAKKGGKSGG